MLHYRVSSLKHVTILLDNGQTPRYPLHIKGVPWAKSAIDKLVMADFAKDSCGFVPSKNAAERVHDEIELFKLCFW